MRATPFLLSKPQLKNMRAVLDFDNDTLYSKVTGETRKLRESRAGHYLFPLMDAHTAQPMKMPEHLQQDEHAYETITVSDHPGSFQIAPPPKLEKLREMLRTESGLTKLHNRLAHPSPQQLMRKIAPALDAKEIPKVQAMVEEITKCCKICDRFKTVSPHPKVGGMVAREVNELAGMDHFEVKVFGKTYGFHHVVDFFSKYSLAEEAHDKSATNTLATFPESTA